MNFLCVFWSEIDGKRKRKKANAGATSRAPQASRSAAQEGHQDHANRGDDRAELPASARHD